MASYVHTSEYWIYAYDSLIKDGDLHFKQTQIVCLSWYLIFFNSTFYCVIHVNTAVPHWNHNVSIMYCMALFTTNTEGVWSFYVENDQSQKHLRQLRISVHFFFTQPFGNWTKNAHQLKMCCDIFWFNWQMEWKRNLKLFKRKIYSRFHILSMIII